ncbi:hypothetical protein SRHO_G00133490 [Serrasalmus rhombeus]
MPFCKRTVAPQRLCRLTKEPLRCELGGADCCSALNPDSWTSLSDVSSTALRNVLLQLSDLSRHACTVFLEIQSEASSVVCRSAALQQRLETLQYAVRKLDHKKITIPVCSSFAMKENKSLKRMVLDRGYWVKSRGDNDNDVRVFPAELHCSSKIRMRFVPSGS